MIVYEIRIYIDTTTTGLSTALRIFFIMFYIHGLPYLIVYHISSLQHMYLPKVDHSLSMVLIVLLLCHITKCIMTSFFFY